MSQSNRLLIALLAVSFSAAPTLAQPVITGLNRSEAPLSGRISISGSGFGSGGTVVIDGLNAWTTTWTGSRVVAFVPEQAHLGSDSVRVVVNGQPSNAVPLNVTQRVPEGRVRWSFEADTDNLWYRPALAPDGTVYLHSSEGFVYAIAPDGGLKWTQKVDWYPVVPPSCGPDGTLYVGTLNKFYAISPAGQIRWQNSDPSAQHIQVATTIGPDGDLYGAFDGGIGAFAAHPANGSIRWSNTGDPLMLDYGNPYGTEAKFGPSRSGGPIDQMYVHMDFHRTLYAFSLDGQQRFAKSIAGTVSHEPAIGSDGMIFIPHFGAAHGWGFMAVDPGNGSTDWIYSPENGNGISELDIGPDDSLYFSTPGRLESVDGRTGSQNWINRHFMMIDWPSISPDGSTVIASGVPTFGQPGFVKAFSANDGSELWTVDLPGDPYPAFRVLGTHHPRFTPDGRTAYVSTFTVSDPSGDPHSYLYAIDVSGNTAYSLTVDNLVGGADAVFTITHATPNRNQYIAYGLRGLGSTFIPQLNVTLDLRQPVLLTSGRADPNGDFAAIVHVPSAATGHTVWFQGAEANRTTPVISGVVQ